MSSPGIIQAARKMRDRYRAEARYWVRRAKFSPERSAADRAQDMLNARSAINTAWGFHRRYMRLKHAEI